MQRSRFDLSLRIPEKSSTSLNSNPEMITGMAMGMDILYQQRTREKLGGSRFTLIGLILGDGYIVFVVVQ